MVAILWLALLASSSSALAAQRGHSEPQDWRWLAQQPLALDWIGPGCGVELWDLKTASDAGARRIEPTMRDATIEQLASMPHAFRAAGERIHAVETTTWKLTNVHLLAVKVENDQDYHLVLGDGFWTMIAEIPAPGCLPTTSVVRSAVSEARRRTEMYFRSGQRSEVLTIAGVGFFDHEHNQTGAALNQLELHPVVAICFGQDCTFDGTDGAQVASHGQSGPEDQRHVPESPEQAKERERRDALARGAQAVCESHALAAHAVQAYRDFLSSCRTWGTLAGRDCSENANAKLASDAQTAMIETNNRENEFLRAWGAEAFIGIHCE